MELNDQQARFLARQRTLVKWWTPIGILLILGIAICFIGIFLKIPLLLNPFLVISQIKNETIQESTLIVMSALLPVTFLTCFVLAIALILFTFAAFAQERKLIEIIDVLRK